MSNRPSRSNRGVWIAGVALLLELVTSSVSMGTESPTGPGEMPPASPQASPANAAYRFAAGDILAITVEPQKSYDRTVAIQPDGKIVFPVVGEILAAGLTVQELTERLERGLEAELKRPRVTVSLKESNKGVLRRVSILGAVRNPGAFELKEQSTLVELLASAGGPTGVADLRRIVITRADGGKRVVDLTGAARTGEASENLILEPGDLITVPEEIPAAVLVLGEVARPGSYDLQGQTRLLDALSRAGGPSPKADLHRLALTRAGRTDTQIFDVQELLTRGEQGDATVNLLLQAGDTLVLPASEQKYYVLGAVARADAYPWKSTDHLLDAIAAAGGFSREADLTKVTLIRKDAAGQPVAKRMDLKRAMTSGKMPGDETLRAGDVIFVADRKRGRPITDFLRFLLPFSGVLGILR